MDPHVLIASLLPFPSIDPVIIQLGPLAVHWYGMAYIVGILLGWWFAKKVVSNPKLWPDSGAPFGAQDLDEFLTWAVIGIIAGGRLGYVLFYNLPLYASEPLLAFAIWDGGMSFHGGALGAIAAMILFARNRGFSAYSLLDVIAASSCFGLFFGRVANFINSELWGRPTDVSWSFIFPTGGPEPRHPSQLYEAGLEGAMLFVVLAILIYRFGKLGTPGFVGGAWVIGYSAARIFVEFFREPDAHIGYIVGDWLTMGMILSLPMIVIGLWGMASSTTRVPWHQATRQE